VNQFIRSIAVLLLSACLIQGAVAQFNVSGPGFLPDENGTNLDDPQASRAAHRQKVAPNNKGTPTLKRKSPDSLEFEYSYLQLEKDFQVNLLNSKKMMTVQVAIMTRYDDRVFQNVKKHELVLRRAMLDIMRLTAEVDLTKRDFRRELAVKLLDAMNVVLEKYENFGGIEELIFTGFIVQ
jgi:flagellar FliL protein